MKHSFPLGFWNYPNVSDTPLSEVARWKNCGMTWTQTPTFDYDRNTPDQLTAFLDEMLRLEMDAFVCVNDLQFRRYLNDPEGFREVFLRAYRDFGTHPAVRGFFIGDEPFSEEEFRACRTAYRIMREISPDAVPLLNFNPYWDGIEYDLLGGQNFDDWLDGFIKDSGCPMICYDHYAQLDAERERGINQYFTNLRHYVGAAKRNGIKVWNTVLSCGHYRYRVPTEDDLRWQISTSVASGCNGLLWFLYYGQYAINNYRGAPVDELGEESDTYTALRRVQLLFQRRYGELMSRLTHDRSWHFPFSFGGYPLYAAGDIPHVRGMVSDHGLPGIVSRFTDADGAEYLVLVNNSQTEPGMFRFLLDGGIRRMDRYWGDRVIDFIKDHHDACYEDKETFVRASLWLAPGQMEVFRIEY